ncbi:MAG: hypothetical protein WBW79_10785 [Desulfocapsaceae bacterium]
MAQTIVIWIIVALCALYIGRRYYRQWRSALRGDQNGGCIESSCSCCSAASDCSSIKEIQSFKEKQ